MDNIINKFIKKIKDAIHTPVSTSATAVTKFNPDDTINIDAFDVVSYFRNGIIYKVVPTLSEPYYDNRNMIYNADAIISDGILYDLGNAESIFSIPIPNFESQSENAISESLGSTGSLDYVIRMKAGQYYSQGNCELCSACLWKSTELMFSNPKIAWNKEDYMRLVYWHYELGMSEEADKALKYITVKVNIQESLSVFDQVAVQCLNSILSRNVDLIVFNDYGDGCCEKCAAYRGRVYSFSGKDKRFPVLPDYAKIHGNFHEGCRCIASPYFDELIYFRGEQVDALIASNRPFIDDRTPDEIDSYNKYLKILEDKAAAAQKRLESSILRAKNKREFDYFRENHPDVAPKTIDGYIKGKRTNSKKFQQLVSLAEKDGIEIDYSAI